MSDEINSDFGGSGGGRRVNRRLLRDVLILIGITLAMLAAAAARGDSVRLRGRAVVAGTAVLLRDVAELEGAEAEAQGDLHVGKLGGDGESLVTLDALRETLTTQGVNWGRLSLG